MPRTEKEIAAYIEYFRTAPKEERAWALNALSRQEGKTPAEIREICEKFKGTNLRKGMAAPDELYERIQSQLRAGQSETEIMRDFGTSATTIAKARRMMKKAEENPDDEEKTAEPPKDKAEVEFEKYVDELEEKRAADKPTAPKTSADFEIEPEGVYRQNFFENPPPEEREPIVEDDVKTYLPGDVAGECRSKLSKAEKFQAYLEYVQPLVDMIWEFFENENPVVQTIEANVRSKSASVEFKTDDGKRRVLKLLEV